MKNKTAIDLKIVVRRAGIIGIGQTELNIGTSYDQSSSITFLILNLELDRIKQLTTTNINVMNGLAPNQVARKKLFSLNKD